MALWATSSFAIRFPEPANGDAELRDILISVRETDTGSFLFGTGVNTDAGLTGSIILNERNFDILRPPTCLEDLFTGRAFQGAGQELRLEAVPGTQLQRYSSHFWPLYDASPAQSPCRTPQQPN